MGQQTFMVMATIRADTDMAALSALIPAEVDQVEQLRSQQRLGSVHVALARRVVFIEVFAADQPAAVQTVATLPMAPFFDLDVYPTTPVAAPAEAVGDLGAARS